MIRTILAACLALAQATAPSAGELTWLLDPMDGYDERKDGPCVARFDGLIESGDSVGDGPIPTGSVPICLNSPGGSLPAGLELGTDKQWEARILPGETCESACAMAFLKAGYVTGNGIPAFFHGRALWAGGKLGLHSPGLDLPDGLRVDTNTVETAFKAALAATSRVYQLHQSPDGNNELPLNSYLYQRFLETPPDDMYYIDTVGDALMSELDILGVERRATVTETLLDTICRNALLVSGRFEISLTNLGRKPNRSAAELMAALAFEADRFGLEDMDFSIGFFIDDGQLIGHAGLYPSGDYRYFNQCFVSFGEDARQGGSFDPDGTIEVYFTSGYQTAIGAALKEVWRSNNGSPSVYLDDLGLFPFDAKLADLPKNALYRKYFGNGGARPVAEPAAAAPVGGFAELIGRDVSGRDLATERVSHANACRDLCKGRSDCQAATYDRWNKRCFLKALDGPARVRIFAKATSFVTASRADRLIETRDLPAMQKRNDKSFPGRADETAGASSYEDCVQICRGRNWCLGLNWRPRNRQCEMFREPPEYFTERGVDIGYLQQGD